MAADQRLAVRDVATMKIVLLQTCVDTLSHLAVRRGAAAARAGATTHGGPAAAPVVVRLALYPLRHGEARGRAGAAGRGGSRGPSLTRDAAEGLVAGGPELELPHR